jgi:hypothetical protein
MGGRTGANRILVGRPEGRKPFGIPGLNGIILKSSRSGMGAWTGLIWLRIRKGGGLL